MNLWKTDLSLLVILGCLTGHAGVYIIFNLPLHVVPINFGNQGTIGLVRPHMPSIILCKPKL